MAVGTIGSGKTIVLRLLMQSILGMVGSGRGVRAIVYDAKQDAMPILSAIANPRRIFTLNPFDVRGVAWDICRDVAEPRVALELAFTLVPKANEQNPFFADASRDIIYGIILSFILTGHRWTLGDVIRAASNPRTARRVLKRHTESAEFMQTYFSDKRLGCTTIGLHPIDLFQYMLIPPDPQVPDFVPRGMKHQFLRPWTDDEQAIFAPAPINHNRFDDSFQSKKNPPFSQNLDDLLN